MPYLLWIFTDQISIGMNEDEKKALVRLTSTDVVGLKHQEINENTSQASQNEDDILSELSGKWSLNLEAADQLRKDMIKLLQMSDLTVNFKVSVLFASKVRGGLLNTFERPGTTNDIYLQTRNRAEEGMFGYSSHGSGSSGNQAVADRLKAFGDRDSEDFVASMRPKYGALNYTNDPNGAAGGYSYGRSYMVLKEHVKHNSTYTAMDSFSYASDPSSGNKVASFLNMDRVIANLDDVQLRLLKAMVADPNARMTRNHYIEAQIHGEIRFDRDVKSIYIDNMDLSSCENEREMRKRIESFSRKYNILVHYK